MEYKKDGFINQRAIVLPHFIKELMIQNELTRLLYVTDIGFYPKAKGHYRIRNKGSEQNILIYCTSKLVMVDDKERGTNWIYPYEKNSDLVYNLLSDKLYLSPP